MRCAVGGDRCRWKSSSWTAGRPITRWQGGPGHFAPAEERQIGGLGMHHMVKKSMDHITYNYEDGRSPYNQKEPVKIKEEKDMTINQERDETG